MISDVYPREADAFGDGTVPLHFVDLEKHERQTLLRIGIGAPIPARP
jgi:hypothetical protein